MLWISVTLSFYPYFITARGSWVMIIQNHQHFLVLSHDPEADLVILVELDPTKIRPDEVEAGRNRYIYEDTQMRVGGPGGRKFTLASKEDLLGQFDPIDA